MSDKAEEYLTPKQIATKYVHGSHDALTDNQEKKDMEEDIEKCFQGRVNAISDEFYKELATKFLYHWWNTEGNNIGLGFDQWWKENKEYYKNKLLKQ